MSATRVKTVVTIAGILVGIVGIRVTIWASRKKKTATITQKTKVFCSPRKKGSFTFDYSSNNGEYVIGEGTLCFERAGRRQATRLSMLTRMGRELFQSQF